MHYIWNLFVHPTKKIREIKQINESVMHHYTYCMLLMAAIPVICTFIGTTQYGWSLADGQYVKIALITALILGIIFYLIILGGIALMGQLIYRMALKYYPNPPKLQQCNIFISYVATPLLLSGLIALYPLVWLCLLVGSIGLVHTGYLLYIGIPIFLNIDRVESLRFSGSTLAIGILILEILLGLTILLWGYGPKLF
ncbi:Yip1 family protein [Candidatus Pantoea carbekii]|uniref:YohC protein n=1 Tax=Candidatus Pantoea carbekii TaxID=1235990 RepID=U3U6V1_9GAMM|nr:Yip1 family protein [Candidatus Pantoea carbekii]AKC32178.1 inner membrane protein YohC [Candidatus Pantoea carbekii]BAO00705.1 YohC protein [Candidatus Pantoea carbekii]